MSRIQFELDNETEMLDVVSRIAQSKGPVQIDFLFQGITFSVVSQLVKINETQVNEQP